MTTRTVTIEAGNADQTIWQAMHPAETVEWDGTVAELTEWVAANQTIAEGDNWRIVIDDAPAWYAG